MNDNCLEARLLPRGTRLSHFGEICMYQHYPGLLSKTQCTIYITQIVIDSGSPNHTFYLELCLPILSKCIYAQKRSSCPAQQLVSVPVYVKTGTDFFIIRKMIICVPLPPIRHRGCLARFYISSRIQFQLSIVRTNHVFSFFVTISIDIN